LANRVPITVRLDQFEGPLDLLLHLIQSHEMQVSKISVAKITDQYLAYVLMMHELNFDFASEFLVMAATLLQWKSKSLLPQEDKPGDQQASTEDFMSEEDLIRQLLEHQRFLAAGQMLAQLPRLGEDVFTRHNPKPPIERVWREMNITDLALGYQDMLVKARKRTQILKKETVSLSDKILDFADHLEVGKLVEMRKLLSAVPTQGEVVVTFLASLELARLKRLKLFQEQTYAEIYLELIATLKNFDINLASGFDNPDAPAPEPGAEPAHVAGADVMSDIAGIAGAFESQFLNSGQGRTPATAEN
jgi:segregation and condensation protein A